MEDGTDSLLAGLRLDDEGKETVNIVFIGHVDAGKSTLGGNILVLTGNVDARTLEKYQQESKELNRESWYLSWALDTSQEERSKGITVEVGRAVRRIHRLQYTVQLSAEPEAPHEPMRAARFFHCVHCCISLSL
jgi:Elongation factor Tu GTP binding domain